jgi:hypothetical protein
MKLRNETRGGARPGSGPKRLNISDKEVRLILKSARAWSKKTGKPFWDRLILIAQESYDPRAALAAFKIFSSIVIAKQTHETKEVYNYSPAILPVLEGDPSKIDMGKAVRPPLN